MRMVSCVQGFSSHAERASPADADQFWNSGKDHNMKDRAIHHNKGAQPEALLRSLGLFEQAANKPKLDARSMDLFASRKLAFDWCHMSNSEISIGWLFDVLRNQSDLSPPRTGHVGNWFNIAHGCAGPRDYNFLVCGPGRLGYPLLLDLNQSESDTAGTGDWVYLPGSVTRRSQRKVLDLFTWDGRDFVKRNRGESYFIPFTLTDAGGELVPLISFHMKSCEKLDKFQFRRQSPLLKVHEVMFRRTLRTLLSDALALDQPQQFLRLILDRVVRLDGRVSRASPRPANGGISIGDSFYRTIDEIIEHVMMPIHIAARPDTFREVVRSLPSQMPMISAPLLVLLLAILNTHYPDTEPVPSNMTRPCNPHLHWGGTSMAGYPPQFRGYFGDSARHLRKLFRSVLKEIDEVDPVMFVLLPATIFNLCPHSSHSRDVELVSSLIDEIQRATCMLNGRPETMSRTISRISENWLAAEKGMLSEYFLCRLAPRHSATAHFSAPAEGTPIVPENLPTLTLQQASMTVGALSQLHVARLSRLASGIAGV